MRYGIGYTETQLWVAVLLVQSVPYMAALYLSLLNTRPAAQGRPAARAGDPAVPHAASAPLPAEAMEAPDSQAA